MISINDLSVHFTGEYIFRNVSFMIHEKDKIGLVGRNGSGKTTLLRIIAGLQNPESGNVVIPSSMTLGYLPQEKLVNSGRTVYQEALEAFNHILELKKLIDEKTHEISARSDYDSPAYQKLVISLSEANDKFQILGGHQFQADTEKVLLGLGFVQQDFNRTMNEFSQGWQMRVELAKILLARPNLILLDEPTNHLDIESIQWLEEYLMNYNGAVILVSHDRAFLDNITKRTIELADQKIYDYKASYSGYVEMREERMELQLAMLNNQQREIRQIERFIERFRYKNTKARQVQSRIKMLDKMERIEIDEMDQTTFHFRFPESPRAGKVIVEADHLTKAYGSHTVLNKISFPVIKNDKIAFVGRNGEGKTTLSRILAGKLEYEGLLKYGHNVKIGYYAQDQWERLDGDKTVFDTIDAVATGDMRTRVRNLLGSFLFSGDTIEKKVKVLSGGEKSRLSLAKLLLTPVNLLIMDEPTNHLDMQSKDMLKNALIQYDGTMIIVSHDRDFLQGLTNKIFEFRNGKVKEYIGDIYDFLEARKIYSLNSLNQNHKGISRQTEGQPSENKLIWEKSREIDREIRKIRSGIDGIEKKIHTLEEKLSEMDSILADPDTHRENKSLDEIYVDYDKVKNSLAASMNEWENLQMRLEELESDKTALKQQ
ncbi:MAG: ABC-F family ATP-binding cassette domain-containing protein [Bacteroidetes bacterium]|nr:ABC-F family ATP-binding cassette domain-containing protein [Bacteroidota bacterium]